MKALVFDKSKNDWEKSRGFDLVDVPNPELDSSDKESVIIKVHYAGVCGTDRGIWNRQAFRDQILGSIDAENSPNPSLSKRGVRQAQKGKIAARSSSARNDNVDNGLATTKGKSYRIIGHEFFGEIAEVGFLASKKYKLKKGDFVSCESHVVCNECSQCIAGEKHVCTNEKILGISQDGAYAEYIKVPAHIVWKTDTSKIRPEIAAMQEPFGNAVHAASKVDVKGKTVAVFGLGPIGLFLVLILRGMEVKNIIGIEPNPVAIEMAKKLGIDYVIQLNKFNSRTNADLTQTDADKNYAHNPEVIDEIMKITDGLGVDVAFEMAGFNSSVNNSIFSTRRGGDVILFGIKTGDFVIEDYNRLIVYGLTLHTVIGRQLWQTWETTRKLFEDPSNKIQEKMYKIILNEGKGTILPIADYSKEKFEEMMKGHPKILIQF